MPYDMQAAIAANPHAMTLASAIRGKWSLDDVESWHARALMTDRDFRRYLALWEMSAWRMSGRAGRRQDAMRERAGSEALFRRRDRVCALIQRIAARA